MARALLMAVLNVTPDSFSDGGRFATAEAAVCGGLELLAQGADWIDVGGESTRPGAPPVSPEEEIARVVPVIMGLARARPGVVISIDTSKAKVAEAAIAAGAQIVNDVSGGADPQMAPLVAASGVRWVLMHMRGEPQTMQHNTHYTDVVEEVAQALKGAVARALEAGVQAHQILVDPGLGFGKALVDNPKLIRATPRFAALGYPVLIGASRKRFIGALTGQEQPQARVHGSVGAACAAALAGAAVIRVHDVAATAEALAVFEASR